MKITLSIGDDLAAGELYDNPVADQVAELLPLEAAFDDFHDQEKLTRLSRALDVSGVPRADEPRPGEIGYYAPGSSLVLYYASPGRWPGLVCIGRFDLPLARLRALPDGTRISIAAAEHDDATSPGPRREALTETPTTWPNVVCLKSSRIKTRGERPCAQ